MQKSESKKVIEADAKNSTGRQFRDELTIDKRKYEADCIELRKKLDKLNAIRLDLEKENVKLRFRLENYENQGRIYFLGTLILTAVSAFTVNTFGYILYYIILSVAITMIICSLYSRRTNKK